jgi:YD repeat-containing protein
MDALNRETRFGYDVEARLTAVEAPDGPTSALSYDVLGKLMGVDVTDGMTDLLPIDYGYDIAANRIG